MHYLNLDLPLGVLYADELDDINCVLHDSKITSIDE